MKSLRRILFPLLVIPFLFSACASPFPAPISTETPLPPTATSTSILEPSSTPPSTLVPPVQGITLTDGLKRTIHLAAPAVKIISLAPSNTEILFAIGAGSQIVGRDSFSDYPKDAIGLTDIGGPSFGSNMELITKLQPDLILAADINTQEQVSEFEKLGLTVFYLSNPTDIAGLYTNLEVVAKLTGREKEAATLIESLKQREAAVNETIAKATDKPVVFYEVDGTDPAKPWTTGPGSFMDTMIRQAGGINAGANLPLQWAQISQEELIVQNPDLILLGDHNFGTTVEQVNSRPGWNAITAVQTQRIEPYEDNLASRPGPRLIDGLEALARAIHPELYK
jgi:iron complex transport system substrate-binding protein